MKTIFFSVLLLFSTCRVPEQVETGPYTNDDRGLYISDIYGKGGETVYFLETRDSVAYISDYTVSRERSSGRIVAVYGGRRETNPIRYLKKSDSIVFAYSMKEDFFSAEAFLQRKVHADSFYTTLHPDFLLMNNEERWNVLDSLLKHYR